MFAVSIDCRITVHHGLYCGVLRPRAITGDCSATRRDAPLNATTWTTNISISGAIASESRSASRNSRVTENQVSVAIC